MYGFDLNSTKIPSLNAEQPPGNLAKWRTEGFVGDGWYIAKHCHFAFLSTPFYTTGDNYSIFYLTESLIDRENPSQANATYRKLVKIRPPIGNHLDWVYLNQKGEHKLARIISASYEEYSQTWKYTVTLAGTNEQRHEIQSWELIAHPDPERGGMVPAMEAPSPKKVERLPDPKAQIGPDPLIPQLLAQQNQILERLAPSPSPVLETLLAQQNQILERLTPPPVQPSPPTPAPALSHSLLDAAMAGIAVPAWRRVTAPLVTRLGLSGDIHIYAFLFAWACSYAALVFPNFPQVRLLSRCGELGMRGIMTLLLSRYTEEVFQFVENLVDTLKKEPDLLEEFMKSEVEFPKTETRLAQEV